MTEGILIGAVLAIFFCAKPLNVFIKELSVHRPVAFAYLVLGLAFLAASWMLGWLGFTCIIVTYLLYQISADGLGTRWKRFYKWLRSFRWVRESDTEYEPPTDEDEAQRAGDARVAPIVTPEERHG